MKIEKVVNFINDEYKKHTIYEANYNKYIENHGLLNCKSPQGLEVRDGNAKYYVIEYNKEIIDDFIIYINDENWITININKFLDDSFIDLIFDYLGKNKYKFIKCYIPKEEENVISHIEKRFDNITKEIVKQGSFEYVKYIINI